MKTYAHRVARIAGVWAGLTFGAIAHAGPFSAMYVFGDSLSDTGNVFAATGFTFPPPPYFAGRFSDGPIWIDQLAGNLGLAAGATPSLLGGNNYAFGGARTGTSASPVPGVLAQVGGLWAPTHPLADPNALYVVVGGGNDLRDARSAFTTGSSADQAGRQAAAASAAGNLFNAIALLASRGAKHVLTANLADLGATPEAAVLGLQAPSTDVTLRFNGILATFEATLETLFADLDVDLLNIHAIGKAVTKDALTNGGAVYGVTNVFTPCGAFPGSIGISCDVSLFSDALHPSSRAHEILADQALLVALPEPGTALLLLASLVGLGAARRRGAGRFPISV